MRPSQKFVVVAAGLVALQTPLQSASEARLVRYPHYHAGKIAFTYLADIWTADENGQNLRRITVNKARDVYPRFSSDGKWIAFSSDRNGNLDVFIVPAEGGVAKALTSHSADDTVLAWAPDSQSILFASNMEDYGVPPDIFVENSPEDNLAGRDRQLEVAVQELLKQIGATQRSTSQPPQGR